MAKKNNLLQRSEMENSLGQLQNTSNLLGLLHLDKVTKF